MEENLLEETLKANLQLSAVVHVFQSLDLLERKPLQFISNYVPETTATFQEVPSSWLVTLCCFVLIYISFLLTDKGEKQNICM